MQEIQRLSRLIPDRLQSVIEIEPAIATQSQLLKSQRLDRYRYLTSIDLQRWQKLERDFRNLLFWHELARIQTGAASSDRSTQIAWIAALSIAFIELPTQNIITLVVALTIAGLAGFRLYQNRWGEQHLRQLTSADRAAIEMAVEFGYDRDRARELLKSALSQVQSQFPNERQREYAARLLVLSSIPQGGGCA